jgi:hypothetical protein
MAMSFVVLIEPQKGKEIPTSDSKDVASSISGKIELFHPE